MNKSSATIKLTKSEIDWVVISLVHTKNCSEYFSNFDNSNTFQKLIDDFSKIKEAIIQGEKKLEKKQYSEEKARTGQEACEECD